MTTSYDPHAHGRLPDFLADGRDDLLATLLDLTDTGTPVRVIAPAAYLDPCGVCPDDVDRHGPPADAVAEVTARKPSGFVYRTPVCVEHLPVEVAWEQRLGHDPVVLVPNGDTQLVGVAA